MSKKKIECPECKHKFKLPNKSKVDVRSLNVDKLQYACNNFAGIVKSVEYFENNFEFIRMQPPDLFILVATGYYASLGSLIRNRDGMDYTKVFDIWEIAMEKNGKYTKQNDALKHNIGVFKEWENSLEYEMEHILSVRDQYFAHIDFVDEGFLLESFQSKDMTKQNDLVKFFRSMVDASNDYFGSVMTEFRQNEKGT